MSLIDSFSSRQQALLTFLLQHREGLGAGDLAAELGISRNATLQHLASFEKLEYIDTELGSSTGGRPARKYRLSNAGLELFPRQYVLMCNLLIGWINNNLDKQSLSQCFDDLGTLMAEQYSHRMAEFDSLPQKINELSAIMRELGYRTTTQTSDDGASEIVANNCVFDQLARDCEQVCELDLSLMGHLLDARIEHQECMVRGGNCCRFGIFPH